MRRLLLLATILVVTCSAPYAQSGQPYAGLEQRPVKALSQQQVDDLKAGRGMGLNSMGTLVRAMFSSLAIALSSLQTSA